MTRSSLLCCCCLLALLLLLAPSASTSSSSPSSRSSVAASSAEGAEATTTTTAAAAAAAASSSSSTARGGRKLLSDRHRRFRRRSSAAPVIDIYVRTYRGDVAWLLWLLRSIENNVEESAFRSLLISVPRNDSRLFEASLLPSFRRSLPIVLLASDDAPFERATRAMKSRTESGGYHAQVRESFFFVFFFQHFFEPLSHLRRTKKKNSKTKTQQRQKDVRQAHAPSAPLRRRFLRPRRQRLYL